MGCFHRNITVQTVDFGETILYLAKECGFAFFQNPTIYDQTGTSAFHKAAANGNLLILQVLLKHKPILTFVQPNNETQVNSVIYILRLKCRSLRHLKRLLSHHHRSL